MVRNLGTLTVALALALTACHNELVTPPPGARRVVIETVDDERLDAVELGQGARVAILSHGATTTKEDLYELAAAFAAVGWRAIAYDARGVGSSTGTRGEDRPEDLRAVVEAVSEGTQHLVLVGGSLGAALSISMAAELDAEAVVALSPPADAYGALAAARALRGETPVLVVVAGGDQPFLDDARRIADALLISPVIVAGDRHGTGMLRDQPDLIDEVVAFADAAIER